MPKDSLSELPSLAADFWVAFDKNKDNRLNKDEIDEAMLDSSIKGKHAAALATMKFQFDWLSSLCADDHSTCDAITRQDLEALPTYKDSEGYLSTEQFLGDAQFALENYQNSTYRTSAADKPTKDDPIQGPLGDCFLMATLSAFADKRSEKILHSISKDNEHNSYTVKLSLGKESWQTEIPKPTESKLAYYKSCVDWPLVYQGAYGRFITEMPIDKKHDYRKEMLLLHGLPKDYKPTKLYEDNLAKGGFPLITMMLVGGQIKVQQFNIDAPLSQNEKETLTKVFVAGIAESYPMVAATKNDESLKNLGLLPNHVYSIVKYLPENSSLLMRNPHGLNSKSKDSSALKTNGEIEVPLETFVNAFSTCDVFYDHHNPKVDQIFKAMAPLKRKDKDKHLHLYSCEK